MFGFKYGLVFNWIIFKALFNMFVEVNIIESVELFFLKYP